MDDSWQESLACAANCSLCEATLDHKTPRILSVYTHAPICTACKQAEEQRADYEDAARSMICECLQTTGKPYGDPQSYCFHHFCPYKCR